MTDQPMYSLTEEVRGKRGYEDAGQSRPFLLDTDKGICQAREQQEDTSNSKCRRDGGRDGQVVGVGA